MNNDSNKKYTEQQELTEFKVLNDSNYVDCAENAINNLNQHKTKQGKVITSNQIRKILSLNSEIYNDVIYLKDENEQLSDEIVGRICYLKVRILYDCAREETVREFEKQTHLIKHIDEVRKQQNQKKYYLLFSKYLEALVGFRAYVFGEE